MTSTFKEPAVPQEQQGSVLDPQQAIDQETQILKPAENFKRSKFRNTVTGLMLLTALTIAACSPERNSYAAEKKGAGIEQIDREKLEEQKAIETLKYIYDLKEEAPNNQEGFSQTQNRLRKKQAINDDVKDTIFSYSLGLKLGFPKIDTPGRLNTEDVKSGIESLIGHAGKFADKHLGNNDGKFDPEEMVKFRKALRENPGFVRMMEMRNNLEK